MASFGDYNRVNTNVTAMDAQLSLNKINRDLGDSRLRLSTGFKINNAEDNAAGFAIATKLKSRVAGLEQALQNVSDAKSVLSVAESSYGSIMDTLIEMKSLTTQAANETLGSTERMYIGDQISALAQDINDIAKSTKFNGISLLDGTSNLDDLDLTFQVGEGTGDTQLVELNAVNVRTLFGTSQSAGADKTLGDTTNGGTSISNTAHNANTTHNSGSSATSTGTTPDNTTLDPAGVPSDAHAINIGVGSPTKGQTIYMDATDDTNYGSIEIDNYAVNAADFRKFLDHIDTAINSMNSNMNNIGIKQSSLSGKEVNLTEAITANSAAKSRIMDTDFAKEQSNSVRLQILQQTATAALSQANMGPQAVLGFLG